MDNALAYLGGQWAWGLEDVTADVSALDSSGRWAVVLPYEGQPTCIRLGNWSAGLGADTRIGAWSGPAVSSWRTSMDEQCYRDAVARTREEIACGEVYQANVCRVLRAPMPDPGAADVAALFELLQSGNPSPYGGFIRVPSIGVALASASPELFIERSGSRIKSGPIKGTGRTAADLLPKDEAENVMIVDLMRNDLSKISRPGSVAVPALMRLERHPGLVHLVSDVVGELIDGLGWPEILDATFPPGSVTGAPKSSALRLIADLEKASRGPYCGAFGWVDADAQTASLAVTIRTFWLEDDDVLFGTGAGITWGSDPEGEWWETELKAQRLMSLAAGIWQGDAS